MKKLHESLFILSKCQHTIDRIYQALVANQPKHLIAVNHFTHNLAYYIIMETVSFLKEYHGGFLNIEPEYKQRLADVREVAKPVIKMINKWNDLEKFRNNIIAHPWRDKANGHKFVVPHQKYYDVPHNLFEYQFLNELIRYVYEIIKAEFTVEAGEAVYYGYKLIPEPKPKKDYSGINDELLTMANKANAIATKLGKDYDVKINQYIFPDENKP